MDADYVSPVRLAWLAGFWDGEGSIGLSTHRNTRILCAQLSHTELDTVKAIMVLLADMRVSGRGYTYQERDPLKHRDAHYVRVTGIGNVLNMGMALLPFAITKKRHWEIAIQWAESRIRLAGGLNAKGHLMRGGIQADKGYSDFEKALAEELSTLNRRGPQDRESRANGRIVTSPAMPASIIVSMEGVA
jgi:hypothetical protein